MTKKEQGRRSRLGQGGEFVTPELGREGAWEALLFAIEIAAPEVILELFRVWRVLSAEADLRFGSVLSLNVRADDLLTVWAERWHLPPEPLIQQALDTLETWSELAEKNATRLREIMRTRPTWGPIAGGEVGYRVDETQPFAATWDPLIETRNKATERTHRQLREWMDRTEARVRKDSDATPNMPRKFSHFEWFVRRQIQGWRNANIREEYHVSESTLRGALKSVAEALGVDLRPQPTGRRPKRP